MGDETKQRITEQTEKERNIDLVFRFLSAPVLECPQCGEGYLDLWGVGLSECEFCGWTNTKAAER